jgi:tetratricopeptide (TPR) repeat protein
MGAKESFEKAKQLFVEGNVEGSVRAFTEALEEGHDPGIIYLSRGVAYLKMNEIDEAIEDLSRAIDADREKANGYYYRGVAYIIKESYEKAISDLDKAIKLKPDYRSAIFARGVANINMGKNQEGAEDIKTAMVYAEAAVQGFADTYGWRTQVEKVIAALEGERRADVLDLSDETMETLRKFLLPERGQPRSSRSE